MINVTLNETDGIVILEPEGTLTKDDFTAVAGKVDPFIDQNGLLKGIIIHANQFPGWDSFSALITHMRFVKEHHKQIAKVAVSTDSVIGVFAEKIATHFLSAEIKAFSYQDLAIAQSWVSSK